MYSSSSSSSQQHSSSNTQTNPNLMRYDSAPSSLLSNTVDSVVGLGVHHQFFSNSISSAESTHSKLSLNPESTRNTLTLLHQGPYGLTDSSNNAINSSSSKTSSSNLIRHSSSPAGFLSHLASDTGTFFLSSLFFFLYIYFFSINNIAQLAPFFLFWIFLFNLFGLCFLGAKGFLFYRQVVQLILH